jgi:hypothetical protein
VIASLSSERFPGILKEVIRRNLRKCPDCGEENTKGNRRCECGYIFPAAAQATKRSGAAATENPRQQAQQNSRSVWPALIPAFLVLGIGAAMVHKQRSSFQAAEDAMAIEPQAPPSGKKCVETYAITLHTSEYHVREVSPGVPAVRKKGAPRELSTVIRGTARNGCPHKQRGVRVRVNVFDEKGKRGSAWAKLGNMAIGQAKPFELAWMGRVTKYEIAEIR